MDSVEDNFLVLDSGGVSEKSAVEVDHSEEKLKSRFI